MNFNYIDLFAGCGGLSLGLYNAGWHGVFAVEKNKDAFTTLEYNLIKNKNHFSWPKWLEEKEIDINILIKEHKNELEQLNGKISLVVGGPPCQGFSMAGKRDSEDLRNKLCKAYLKFIRLVQPKVLIFENVHGFTVGFTKDGHKDKPYSEKVINSLKRMGYKVKGKLVDVSEYGIPQKRKRFILIGVLNGNPNNFFELLTTNKIDFLNKYNLDACINIKDAIGDLEQKNGQVDCPDSKNFKSGIYGEIKSNYQKLMRKYNLKDQSIPDSHRFAKHNEKTVELFEKLMAVSDKCIRISPKQNLVEDLKKRGVTPLKENCICNTVTSIPDDYIHYSEPRILTVREMARIQSFPDWYEFKGKYTTGGKLRKIDVPRYTQVANAVPPLFAEQVGLALKEMLKSE